MSQSVVSSSSWEIHLKGTLLILTKGKTKNKPHQKKQKKTHKLTQTYPKYTYSQVLSAVLLLRHPKMMLMLLKCSNGISEVWQSNGEHLKPTSEKPATDLPSLNSYSSHHQSTLGFQGVLVCVCWGGGVSGLVFLLFCFKKRACSGFWPHIKEFPGIQHSWNILLHLIHKSATCPSVLFKCTSQQNCSEVSSSSCYIVKHNIDVVVYFKL